MRSGRCWLEFALAPPDVSGVLWIPVDLWELRKDGRTSRNYKQEWKHFGTSDLLRHTIPVAFYFHPPANYRSYNVPALFGIRHDNELPSFGTQAISFDVNSLPNRGGRN